MSRPLLVLSDTHLSRDYGDEVGRALAQLIAKHSECELVLAGDILDLSLDDKHVPVQESLEAALTPHSHFVQALTSHVHGGNKLTVIPGNHDAALTPGQQSAPLRRLLNAPNDQSVEISPWFVRRAGVHIEHGHLYDPDCANNHPLANHDPSCEGLGTALMRRFVSPQDAISLAHANQTTPISGIYHVFKKWGARAPLLILNYFRTAIALCAEAALQGKIIANSKEEGEARLQEHASKSGLDAQVLRELLELAPEPTHHNFRATFFRLYFDRIFAACALGAGLSMVAMAGLHEAATSPSLFSKPNEMTAGGAIIFALGAGYLMQNIATTKNRYGNLVISQLREAAKEVRAVTDCSLVIFGHTHVEADEPGYVNLGSFGYGRPQRPYLLVDSRGQHQRCWL